MTRFACLLLFFCTSAIAHAGETGYTMPLFDGESLVGWHVTGCEVVIDDGNLLLKGGDGFARTDRQYRDFVLELEFKPLKDAGWDSGIYIRAPLPSGNSPWPQRYQVNLKQGQEGNLIGVADGKVDPKLVKSGDWNRFRLTVVGDTAALEVNGQPAWKVAGLEAAQGYIGLQSEVPLGGQFLFREMKITELGYQSLFNGQDLTGWEGASGDAAACWKVEDGVLLCTGQKGPWLRSQQQYGDFNLRFEYKVLPGGNSGVYVRVPKSGAHHGKDAGVEIQVLDDSAPRYAKLKDYQYCGSVYAIAPSTKHVGRGPETWNTLEIDVVGQHYRITHNGTQIVNASAADFPKLEERLREGYLGLQNHSEEVYFRHIRIGKPLGK